MTSPSASQPSDRTLFIGVAVTVGVIAATVLIIVLIAGGTDHSAAETTYLDEVSKQLSTDLDGDNRQPFIAAGYELCKVIDPESAAVDSRAILQEHGLGEYMNEWVFISAAAAHHLC